MHAVSQGNFFLSIRDYKLSIKIFFYAFISVKGICSERTAVLFCLNHQKKFEMNWRQCRKERVSYTIIKELCCNLVSHIYKVHNLTGGRYFKRSKVKLQGLSSVPNLRASITQHDNIFSLSSACLVNALVIQTPWPQFLIQAFCHLKFEVSTQAVSMVEVLTSFI